MRTMPMENTHRAPSFRTLRFAYVISNLCMSISLTLTLQNPECLGDTNELEQAQQPCHQENDCSFSCRALFDNGRVGGAKWVVELQGQHPERQDGDEVNDEPPINIIFDDDMLVDDKVTSVSDVRLVRGLAR